MMPDPASLLNRSALMRRSSTRKQTTVSPVQTVPHTPTMVNPADREERDHGAEHQDDSNPSVHVGVDEDENQKAEPERE
jgi:hypothetical protein